MKKEIEIPEGYEGKIEGNKVILVPKESEDERTRNEIIAFIEQAIHRGGGTPIPKEKEDRWIAYLEKQKEPEWCHHKVDLSGCSEEYRKGYYDGWNNCNQQHSQLQAEQKPAEWSEEDETNGWTGEDLGRYLSCLQRLGTGNPQQPETINSKWFKEHCRPQPHWKPSREQMKALLSKLPVVKGGGDKVQDILESLYDDLSKL